MDVGFNKEVAEDAAIYWSKKNGNLANLIDKADKINAQKRAEYGRKAKQRIKDTYSWQWLGEIFSGVGKRYDDRFLHRKLVN